VCKLNTNRLMESSPGKQKRNMGNARREKIISSDKMEGSHYTTTKSYKWETFQANVLL